LKKKIGKKERSRLPQTGQGSFGEFGRKSLSGLKNQKKDVRTPQEFCYSGKRFNIHEETQVGHTHTKKERKWKRVKPERGGDAISGDGGVLEARLRKGSDSPERERTYVRVMTQPVNGKKPCAEGIVLRTTHIRRIRLLCEGGIAIDKQGKKR